MPIVAPGTARPQPIKGVLAMRRITGRALAEELDCSHKHLLRVINGERLPSRAFADRAAELLELPTAELFRLDDTGRVAP